MATSFRKTFRPDLEHLEDRTVPTVTYHGGPGLPQVQAENLYLGSAWYQSGGIQTAHYLLGFTNSLVHSSFMDALNTYGVGRGNAVAGSSLNYNLGGVVTDGQIQWAIQQAISTRNAYQPGSNSLYVVFVQPNVAVQDSQGETSSSGAFLGYHSYFVGRDIYGSWHYIPYAVIAYPGGTANPAPQTYAYPSTAAELTDVASHEIAEAVTDPLLNSWYDDRLGEVGDVTNRYHQYLGGYYVQLIANRADQAMIVSNSPIYYVGNNGTYVSRNYGATWSLTAGYDHPPAPAQPSGTASGHAPSVEAITRTFAGPLRHYGNDPLGDWFTDGL